MSRIILISHLSSRPATKHTWRVNNTPPYIFKRMMPSGLVLVESYVADGESFVSTIIDGTTHSCMYNHSPITSQQAAHLVNRFLKDIADARK